MKKLLWVGDAGCATGFARATHGVLDVVHKHYEVHVLGLNWFGDPDEARKYPYPMHVAAAGGDSFGVNRIVELCDRVKPDVIVIQNDPWNFPAYLQRLQQCPDHKNIPVVGSVAVDGKNCRGDMLRGLKMAIFWTEFGKEEAIKGGFTGTTQTGRASTTVVPLGVDRSVFYPMDKEEARRVVGLAPHMPGFGDAFIVGSVNRNQPRKRWDLTVQYFCEWVKDKSVDDAFLFLHTAPTGDVGVDVLRLMAYYGLERQLILVEPPMPFGKSNDYMRATYNSSDVCVSTTQGEGMGLTTLEAMACKVACIAPGWSALGSWGQGAIKLIPCTSTAIGLPHMMNVIGGVADKDLFIEALDEVYCYRAVRERLAEACYARACEPQFEWNTVGECFLEAINYAVQPTQEEVMV